MAVMRMVGTGHALPSHTRVREEECRYVVELDLSDFTDEELEVEANEPVESWEDPDLAILRRAYVPPAKPPVRHDPNDRTPVGLGLEE